MMMDEEQESEVTGYSAHMHMGTRVIYMSES